MNTSLFLRAAMACGFVSLVATVGCSGSGSASGGGQTSTLPQTVPAASVRSAAEVFQIAPPAPSPNPSPVAYVTSYYTTTVNNNTIYHTQVDSFNTVTNTFVPKPIATPTGLPEASSLSGDGKILYLTLPISSATQQGQKGYLDAYAVTATSAKLLGSATYPQTDFDLAYAGVTGAGTFTDVFLDTTTAASFTLDTNALIAQKTAPALSSLVEYAYTLYDGSGYLVDRAGDFRVYDPVHNVYSQAVTGVTSAVTPGIPVLAVPPNRAKVYGLVITGRSSATIDVINPAGPTLVKQIGIGFQAYEIMADHAGAHVYAIGQTIVNNTPVFHIAVIAIATDTVTSSFVVPDSTLRVSPFMAVTPDSLHLLLTAGTGSGATSTSLDVINPINGALVTKVALPLGPAKAPVQAQQVWTPR